VERLSPAKLCIGKKMKVPRRVHGKTYAAGDFDAN
jgi:hypothetical protein